MVDDATLRSLKDELARCEKEMEEAKEDARSSHVRLQAVLIRLNRARTALELAMSEEAK